MACLTCRQRKIRCMPSEHPPTSPCARCLRKNLPCEYVPADKDEYSSSPQSPDFPESPPSPMPPSSASYPTPSPSWNTPSPFPDFSSNRGRGGPPSLPYTGPPPMNRLPRYAGRPPPDLSLSSQSTSMPTHMQSPMPGYSPYYGATASQPHARTNAPPFAGHPGYGVQPAYASQDPSMHAAAPYAPQNFPYPNPNPRAYTQVPPMPFFADTRMPSPEAENPFDWAEDGNPADNSSTRSGQSRRRRYTNAALLMTSLKKTLQKRGTRAARAIRSVFTASSPSKVPVSPEPELGDNVTSFSLTGAASRGGVEFEGHRITADPQCAFNPETSIAARPIPFPPGTITLAATSSISTASSPDELLPLSSATNHHHNLDQNSSLAVPVDDLFSTIVPNDTLYPPKSKSNWSRLAWKTFKQALVVLKDASVIFPPLQVAASALIHVLQQIEEIADARHELATMAVRITALANLLHRYQGRANDENMENRLSAMAALVLLPSNYSS
ncbi:hypothetical protein B0H19DRAFT_1079995 [Mycena capillaripes]|nr:hypothetical protein B0H19DRAFT_1079995 [Mycena capillaripes]